MKRVMPIFGTRPEAVKMAPVILELRRYPEQIDLDIVVTGQHREMLDQVLDLFDIRPDHDLNIMQPGQTLSGITSRVLSGLDALIADEKPDIVLVQGDTTTVLAGALAAFYHQVSVGHVEAGLRTDNKYDPFPEEMNRRLTGTIADLHFAPTETSRDNLVKSGVAPERIFITGNTGIDALLSIAREIPDKPDREGHREVLVTMHRRENWGEPLGEICLALRDLVEGHPDVRLAFPMHRNPVVRKPATTILGGLERVDLIEPLPYRAFVERMRRATIIITDSGGVQEEAPSLGIPVLVIRRTTERPEGVAAGTAKLIGTKRKDLVYEAGRLLDDPAAYAEMAGARNPYGDGSASIRIREILFDYFGL